MRRSRAPSFAQRQAYYRCIEAEIARDVMDREVERRRRAGLVPSEPAPAPAPPKVAANPRPPTMDELVEATARALKGEALTSVASPP